MKMAKKGVARNVAKRRRSNDRPHSFFAVTLAVTLGDRQGAGDGFRSAQRTVGIGVFIGGGCGEGGAVGGPLRMGFGTHW